MHHYLLPAKKLEHIGCSPFFRRVEGVREDGEDGGTMMWRKVGSSQTRQTAAGWKCRNLEGAVPGFGKL